MSGKTEFSFMQVRSVGDVDRNGRFLHYDL